MLKWKPDFDETIGRFDAWWRGEVIDRPPARVSVTPTRAYAGPTSSHATLRDRWMDATFAVDAAIASMAMTDYVGDAFPAFCPNVGPEITGTLFGCELEFGEHTSWSVPIVHDVDDWQKVLDTPASFDNVYWQAIESMTRRAIELCDGRFVVGMTDLHGNFDILASLREPMNLCTDVVDCPDVLAKACAHVSAGFVAAFDRQHATVSAAGFGSTSWMPTYHRGPAYVPSADFWCMMGDDDARDLVLPNILIEMASLERSIFHLDGPQALRHLDLLLAIPQLNAIQWVYGAGAGPASKWIDVYKKIRAGNKSLQLLAHDADDALAVIDEIGTRGVFVDVAKPFDTARQANEFLNELKRRS
jgi:hypothetical protein